jgi:ribonuclease Z
MECKILGCGEAFDETLPNTCVLFRYRSAVLCDCGYSAPPQVWKAVPDPNAIDLVYISHPHADHYFGLPALTGRMWEDGRTKPLTIMSQHGVLDLIRDLLEYGYRGLPARYKYPIEYVTAKAGQTVETVHGTFRFAETRHAVTNLAMRLETEGKAVCYSGDGMITEAGRELFAGADLVVHEAYSFEPSPVHADIPTLMEAAASASVRKLAMVHVQRGLRREAQPIREAIAKTGSDRFLLPEPMDSLSV